MASGSDCCSPCDTVPPVNIPGTPGPVGPAGADGSDGINAFTFVDAPGFVVPVQGNNVTVPTINSTWESVGQNVEIEGAGTFEVVSVAADGLSTVLTYLVDYVHNTNAGSSIAAGAKISPAGTQPSFLPQQAFYAVGSSQALTGSNAQLLSAVVTLPTAGKYLLTASVRIDFSTATTVASLTVFLKLRETTNGPADVANAVREMHTGIVTNSTQTLGVPPMPNVVYTAAAGDTIQLQGSVSVVPYSGSLIVVEATILAIPLS